jgi:hypothetical protein
MHFKLHCPSVKISVIFVSRNETSADYPDITKCAATALLKSLDLEIVRSIASTSSFTKRRLVCCKYYTLYGGTEEWDNCEIYLQEQKKNKKKSSFRKTRICFENLHCDFRKKIWIPDLSPVM